MKKIISFILGHKIIALIVLAVIVAGSYFGYQKLNNQKEAINYVMAAAEKGMLISSISGTGQVSATNLIDIKPEASGKVIYVGVKNNQEVKGGQLIARLDATDALKSLRDAEISLENAEISLAKLLEPASALSILQAENNLVQAEEALANAEDDLDKAYEDGFNDVADAFLDLPSVMSGLEDIFFTESLNFGQWNLDYYADAVDDYESKIITYRNDFYDDYQLARTKYDSNFDSYKATSRFSDKSVIEDLIDETYETVKYISEAVKSGSNLVDLHKDIIIKAGLTVKSGVNVHQNSLASYTNTVNGHLTSLLNTKNTISNSKESIINNQRTIQERRESLADLKAAPDELDVRSQELTIEQRKNSLADAQANLANYSIYTPSDGVITNLDLSLGQSVSSASVIANFLSNQKLAEVTLNEIDAAQVKVGQKANLTFDAVPDLSVSGEVAEVDTLGSVTQGVVSYGVKIIFDVQDERIKPGMSVSVSIIIEAKSGVLMVPVSAVKIQGQSSYVEVLINEAVERKTVTTGLSNDTMIEIVDGLEEGEEVITQTLNSSSSSSANQNMGPGGFGGEFRMIR